VREKGKKDEGKTARLLSRVVAVLKGFEQVLRVVLGGTKGGGEEAFVHEESGRQRTYSVANTSPTSKWRSLQERKVSDRQRERHEEEISLLRDISSRIFSLRRPGMRLNFLLGDRVKRDSERVTTGRV